VRIGQNPAKFIQSVPQPERVTVATVTYIPVLGGYFEHSLDVLKVCLDSIWENTQKPYDLMVFDNASCPEVQAYLTEAHDQGLIQYLMLSEKNIGKAGAWNVIFGAAPGEIIAYADSDVYYFPGWLSASLELVEAFPNVGMVTAMPMWSAEEYSTKTVEWAEGNPDVLVERGEFLPFDEHWRHARSLGVEEERAREFFADVKDIRLTYQDKQCYVGAGHFQFIGYKKVFQSLSPIPNERPMGQVRLLDIALNEAGYLRLCTPDWWVQHMGNTLAGVEFLDGKPVVNLEGRKNRRHRLLDWKPFEDLVYWIYHRLFEFLHK